MFNEFVSLVRKPLDWYVNGCMWWIYKEEAAKKSVMISQAHSVQAHLLTLCIVPCVILLPVLLLQKLLHF